MPSRDGGRPIGQGRREGKQSDRFELSRQTGLRRKAKGKRKRTRITRIERINVGASPTHYKLQLKLKEL